jgi:hypothetical protein
MTGKIKRTVASLAALVALALGGAAIAGATGGGSGGSGNSVPAANASPAVDNHADGEINDDHGATVKVAKDAPEHGQSAGDADGSAQAEASE